MRQLKALFAKSSNAVRNTCIAATGLAVAGGANAAIDVTAVKTAMDANQQSGETVGGYVILVVVALAVVTMIISLVKKA